MIGYIEDFFKSPKEKYKPTFILGNKRNVIFILDVFLFL
jgi:hypothetical protein